MYQSKRYARGRTVLALVAATVIAVPVAAIAAPPSGGGGSTPSPVLVTNDATKPVPVSLGGQTVQVTVGNQPMAVSVVPTGEPVRVTDPMLMQPGETTLTKPLLKVPEGKRLVVEFASASVILPVSGGLTRYTLTDHGAGPINLALEQNMGLEGGDAIMRGTFSGPIKYVVDGPRELHAEIFRRASDLQSGVANPITIQGTLYDCETCK